MASISPPPKLVYREPDAVRLSSFWKLVGLGSFTCALFLSCAWLGFGTQRAMLTVLVCGIAGLGLMALNTFALRNPALHIALVLLAVGFFGPTSIGLAWYASHAFGVATWLSGAGLGALLGFLLVLGIMEARHADLAAFSRELLKNGGLRKRADGVYDFRLKGAPRDTPHGAFFRPIRWARRLDMLFAFCFAVVLMVVAPIAFTSAEPVALGSEVWIFVAVFAGSGWLMRTIWTGAVVNWRLLAALRRGDIVLP